MRRALIAPLLPLCLALVFALAAVLLAVQFASADTLPPGVSQAQIDAAMSELSKLYGSPVVRVDQAKAICNQEKFIVECAEIGRRNGLFPKERAAQVDALLDSIKGEVVSKLKECSSVECLVDVARSVSQNLSASNPSLARTVDLTPQKVDEKQVISDAAKSAGVDIRQCQTMDPDTASLELLRGCAKLAKNASIQKFIPEAQRDKAGKSDSTIALKEALSKGELSCGDGTIEGCGTFCLSAGSNSGAAIPAVCRDIAQRFFGQDGITDLEKAHENVQQKFVDVKEKFRSPPDGGFDNNRDNRNIDNRNFGATSSSPVACPIRAYQPCPDGQYRQDGVSELGCRVLGSCIPFDTKTQPEQLKDKRVICPALPTIDSCPNGAEKVISFVSPECGTYYTCKPSGSERPVPPPPSVSTTQCSRFGASWHSMDESGNCFNAGMTEYLMPNGVVRNCSESPVYGCAGAATPTTTNPPGGQKEQVWNASGLRSWIRTDASASRIETLKSACANVRSADNVWMPGSGTQSSPDFGMPDPAKCATARSCTSSQYFDGSSCKEYSSNTSSNAQSGCQSAGGTWDSAANYCKMPVNSGTNTGTTTGYQTDNPSTVSGSCSSTLVGLLGNGCHSMSNAWFNGTMNIYVMPNTTQVKSCDSAPISGCSGSGNQSGVGSSCTSGQYWNGSACVSSTTTTCPSGQYWNGSSCVTTSTTDCTSGQYWNGSACVSSSQGAGYPSAQAGCASAGGTWSTTSNYCIMPNSAPSGSSSCPSGQYWNGSACVNSSTSPSSSSCGADQYWDGSTSACKSMQSACTQASGTWDSAAHFCRMPSSSADQKPLAYLCPHGHLWNGAYCTPKERPQVETYVANVLSAFMSLIGF